MTIIHFIKGFETNNSQQIFLKEILADSEAAGMSSYILLASSKTGKPACPTDRLYKMPEGLWLVLKGHKRFNEIINAVKPDIVHIHSTWGVMPWLIYKWARELRIPIVLSPHKSMMEWNFRHNYLFSKLPQFLFMQRNMLKNSSAIHCITAQEYEQMKQLSWLPVKKSTKPYNKNLVQVLATKASPGNVSHSSICQQMKELYTKVVDSNPFCLMSDSDRELENMLIALGVAVTNGVQSENIYLPVPDISDKLKNITAREWRLIQLHSLDQGVANLVDSAAQELLPDVGILNYDGVDRFGERKEVAFLETAHARIRVSRMKNLADSYRQYETEKKICVMMLNTKYLYAKGLLTRRNLADLYAAFRYSKYDEYVLEEMLHEIGIYKFTSRILYILHMSMNLEEGFVPIVMTNDRTTKGIAKKFFKSNIQ